MDKTKNLISVSPAIQLKKVELSEYLEILRKRINKGYMPSSHGSVKYNSKPYYERADAIGRLSNGSGYYSQCPEYHSGTLLNIEYGVVYFGIDGYQCSKSGYNLLGSDSPIKDIMIITNLNEPSLTHVNVKGMTNEWLGWTLWIDDENMTIPINKYELEKCIDVYG
jgi:hypothetical protein